MGCGGEWAVGRQFQRSPLSLPPSASCPFLSLDKSKKTDAFISPSHSIYNICVSLSSPLLSLSNVTAQCAAQRARSPTEAGTTKAARHTDYLMTNRSDRSLPVPSPRRDDPAADLFLFINHTLIAIFKRRLPEHSQERPSQPGRENCRGSC